MAVDKIDHVGIAVQDLAAAVEFFEAVGFRHAGGGSVSGDWVGRVIGLENVETEIAMLDAPGGGSRVELFEFVSPEAVPGGADLPSNALGIRHFACQVDDLDETLESVQSLGFGLVGAVEQYEDAFKLCYVRGPEGIIIELAEPL